jgi:short-subunit dehydrogenase
MGVVESFAGRVVVITGASEGIGRALALELARDGPRLALAARDAQRLETLARECEALGAETVCIATDVTEREACRRLVEQTIARFGALDVLVNNAGITLWTRFDEAQDLDAFERVMRVNYFGALYLTSYALPHLKRSRGLVVAVASVAGLTGVPERTGYAASKHAMVGFFESLRIELAGTGVDVTIIAPDFVVSEIHRRAIGPDGRPLGRSPMRESRIMTAGQCARLVRRAMARRERLLVTSWRGRFGRFARLFAPALVDRIAARAIRLRN